MTPKNIEDPSDDSRGVLDDAASLDTAGIGILGGTAQVPVALPQGEDDDLDDEGVVEGEVASELAYEESLRSETDDVGRIQEATSDIVIEIPADAEPETDQGSTPPSSTPESAPVTAEVVIEPEAARHTQLPEIDGEVAADQQDEREVPEATTATPTPITKPSARSAEPTPVTPAPVTPPPASATAVSAALSSGSVASPKTDGKKKSAKTPKQPKVPKTSKAPLAPKAEKPAASSAPAPAVNSTAPLSASPGSRDEAPRTPVADTAAAQEMPTTPRRTDAAPTQKQETTVPTEPAPAKAVATRPAAHAARTSSARQDVSLTSKRLGELSESSRESADLLTADRLLDPHHVAKPEPEGAWSHFLYTLSGRRINIGDGKRARARKELSARIAAPLSGGARFVPVLSRKGGVGKTAITALLGMALADARDDRVIAVDANPDRGTLAERIVRSHSKSVRDLVRVHDEVKGYHDISAIVARDATRLDVLASDTDPRIADAFSDEDYRDVAGVAAHYYSLVLTDTGTGIVHSVMGATLDLADQLVIVSGLSVDEARLASETLTWLETNGYAEQSREAIVVLNQSTPGAPLVRLNELEAHFATRARHVVRMPYDAQIAGGGAIVFANLQPETRQAARELAALLVEGLRAGTV
ncbi:MAG: MinD/ParA family protein [Actinomycetota bacterium]